MPRRCVDTAPAEFPVDGGSKDFRGALFAVHDEGALRRLFEMLHPVEQCGLVSMGRQPADGIDIGFDRYRDTENAYVACAVDDAPPDYVQQMLRAIVGIRIPLTRLVGKWKVSQNRSEADRLGVGLGLGDDPMAALVRGRG